MRVQATIMLIAFQLNLNHACLGQDSGNPSELPRETIVFSSATRFKNAIWPLSKAVTDKSSQTTASSSSEPTQASVDQPLMHAAPVDRPPVALAAFAGMGQGGAPATVSSMPASPTMNVEPFVGRPTSNDARPLVDLQPPPATNPQPSESVASRELRLKQLKVVGREDSSRSRSNATLVSAPMSLQAMAPVAAQTPTDTYTGSVIPFEVLALTKLTSSATDSSPLGGLTTGAMTGPMNDPGELFARLHISPVPAVQPLPAVRTQSGAEYCPWASEAYTWFTPTFYHRPLYFEQPNLERYGIGTYRCLQPAASSAHFFTSVALLPYKTLTQHPCEKVYTLGYDRPGNCAAFQGRSLIGQSTVGEAFKVWNPYSGY